MKKIKNFMILIISCFVFLSCSEDDKAITVLLDNVERGAVLRTFNATNTYNFYDPNDSRFVFDLSVEAQTDKSAVLKTLRLYQSYKDNTDDGFDNNKAEVLINTIDVSTLPLSDDNGFPQFTLPTMTLADALNISGLNDGEFFGLDQFIYRFELESEDGRIFSDDVGGTVSGGSFFLSPFSYVVTIKCVPIIAIPGVYTIKMSDDFGDGWQTDDPNGGSGITLDLDGTVIEFGLCSPYQGSSFACTPGDSAGETTVEIPVGTTTATWYFPGDFYGEISFKIIDPFGNTALEAGLGTSAGELFLNICQ